jgi:hypothetical protein
MEECYRELAAQRRKLNEDMPEVTSRWYEELNGSIYEEVDSHEEAKERLIGEAKLIDSLADEGTESDDVEECLTGSARIEQNDEE